MKLLLIHARRFWYHVTEKALEDPEPIDDNKEKEFSNALVVLTSIEENDDYSIADQASIEILDVASKVKPDIIVLYPYAHLSNRLASPPKAFDTMKYLERKLKDRSSINIYRAPFGWYKAFQLECLGHPLSELSKSIEKKKTGEIVRQEIKKEYIILTPEGKIYKPEEFDYTGYDELRILVEKEVFGKELPGGVNKVNQYCRKFGFEWEPFSDHGHMRYGPHATAIMEAVGQYSWIVAQSLGIPIFKVMGTNTFDLSRKPVLEHAKLFGDRLYELEVEGSRYVLRYAACHQQFAMLRDWVISYRNLPMGMFELADSYRLEKRGELNICFRMRKFYMPDLHILTKDLEEAIEVSKKVQEKIFEEVRKVGREYVALYNITRDFFEQHFDNIIDFIRKEDKPVLVALLPGGIYYWVLNVEYHIIDNLKRPREIATFQIDIGNGERFGITYVTETGDKKHPVIIHTAIIGSLERYIYMIFDTAAQLELSGKTPYIPTWISPIQVRVIPITKEQLKYAKEVALRIRNHGFRVDIDDREESLGKKIREAAKEWIPYMVVIGQREVDSNTINVRIRRTNDQRVMTVGELIEILEKETEGYPKISQTLSYYVSHRPGFSYVQ